MQTLLMIEQIVKSLYSSSLNPFEADRLQPTSDLIRAALTASKRFENSDWFVKAEDSAEDLSGKVGTNTFAAVNIHRPRTASATGKCVTYSVRRVAGVFLLSRLLP